MNKLEELALRCERATGPDEQLERDIARELYGAFYEGIPNNVPTQTGYIFPRYSSSIDAAMSLVPEGWRVAEVGETVVECSDPWRVRLFQRCKHDRDSHKTRGDAATFALALAAASLRARSMKEGSHGEG